MANWLITGGAGFIGSHITEELLRRKESVKVFDNFSFGKRENLIFSGPDSGNLEIVEGDIRDIGLLEKELQNIDYVLHQAALRSVPKSFDNPKDYDEVNVKGTMNVLLAALKCKVKRVVYASSSSVYGERDDMPEREADLPNPLSIYAATKLNGEYYCNVFSALYGLKTVILRYFNVFGERQSLENKYAVVVPKFITSFIKREEPPIYGDGLQSRDFTYVGNVVKANILAAEAEQAGGAFNIAGGRAYTVLELFELVKEHFKIELKPKFQPPRIGDVKHTLADISRAKEILGYSPEIQFKEGVLKTIEWFKENNS
ncbi:MAG TPA: SDR family oxidoreductase [Candidatus Omnitrophica bacterium]|nr:SDR family oxidoreductase [Candidatus Omnitrophota bacterium]